MARPLLLCALAVVMVVVFLCGGGGGCEAGRGTPGSVVVVRRPYGKVRAGRVVLATLERGPLRVQITNWGATITALYLPDAKGKQADVVLGLDSFKDYKDGSAPYFGAIVGRVANRIAGGTFVLDHVRYNLTKNNGNNTLHGGKIGYDKVLWDATTMLDENDGAPCARFTYHSFDGEQGFPGDLNVTVTYKLTNDMELVVDMKGVVGNKTTPVNLAQHTYWNLGGHNSGTILNDTIQIAGDRVTVVDQNLIPTGELKDVKGTPYDFTNEATIGGRIDKVKGGYDINYELKGGKLIEFEGESLHFAARVREPSSGRVMEVYTNQPGMQFYTSNMLSGVKGKNGAVYGMHDGLCLETQGFPNAVNEPNFPSIVVKHGHVYHHKMLYRFSIVK